ncbi:WG repeat-containing protein [Sphingobacterium sp. HMA12]|uniref:WG repeat-containing protein n=1 Tax=Sphingobacterium sp. HMA12 TaxID=2050894 RepID=UPI001315259F|nr:WG repeat-containing protein [Sphingobacterium sp. HMA12]
MATIVFISDSCQGQDVTKATKIGVEKTVLPISQLQGKYNAVEDIWENQDAAYEQFIRFDGESLATFYRTNANGDLGTVGIIDKEGKVIVQPNYFSTTTKPHFGFFEVQDSKQRVGLVNVKGVQVVTPQYESVFLDAGLMAIDSTIIKVAKDGKQGFIDHSGAIVVPLKYQALDLVGKNRVMYMESSQHWGLMDYASKIITDPVFTSSNIFVDGKTVLQQADGEQYVVFEDGRIVKK